MDYQTPALRIARSLVIMEVGLAAVAEKHPDCPVVQAAMAWMVGHHKALREGLDECAGALGLDVAILLSAGGK